MSDEFVNTVDGKLFYGIDDGVMPVNETKDTITKIPIYSGNFDPHITGINNGRKWDRPFNIDIHGFELISHRTQMINFLDTEELNSKYYEEIRSLIKHHVGAKKVHIFDHTLRTGDDEKREEMLLREPVKRVHNDYTDWSGPERLHGRECLHPARECPQSVDAGSSLECSVAYSWPVLLRTADSVV